MEFSITQQPPPPARGGTELMYDRLKDAFYDQKLFGQVQLVLSQHQPLDGRPAILWLHDLPNQPGPVSALANGGWKRYAKVVFVSHWQREMFHLMYRDMPLSHTTVIYNGIDTAESPTKIPNEVPSIFRLMYASTPHRGLELLPTIIDKTAERIPKTSFTCDVFSSFKLYGRPDDDKQFQAVFDAVRNNPRMAYRGTVSNAQLRKFMRESHILVYPCIYQETFCLTMVEAMTEGMFVVAPAYGAIPEVGGRWVHSFPMVDNRDLFIEQMVDTLTDVIKNWSLTTGGMGETHRVYREEQMKYMKDSFQFRVTPWIRLYLQVLREHASPNSTV